MANVAMLATVADSTASQTAGAISPLMPSGVILPYAGSTSPSGWLVCDGTAYSQTAYPTLFAALGTTYNTQIDPTTGLAWAAPSAGQFRVPDMRGLFLRGEGTASGGDVVSVGGHQVQKTAKNGLSATSSAPSFTGSVALSQSENANHSHGTQIGYAYDYAWEGVGSRGNVSNTYVDFAVGRYGVGYSGPHTLTSGGISANHQHNVTASGTNGTPTITVANGDNETRPMNRGVRYIIKV